MKAFCLVGGLVFLSAVVGNLYSISKYPKDSSRSAVSYAIDAVISAALGMWGIMVWLAAR